MNQRAAKPAGLALYTEALQRTELEVWAAAERLAGAALDPVAELTENYSVGALNTRGGALRELRRVPEAVPLVQQMHEQRSNDIATLSFRIRTLAGFLIVQKGQVLEVPGDGSAASLKLAYDAANTLIQVAEHEANQLGINKFLHKPWWEARVDQLYVIYRLGQVDTSQAGKHKTLLEGLRNQAPEFGEAVCGRNVPLKLQWLLQR